MKNLNESVFCIDLSSQGAHQFDPRKSFLISLQAIFWGYWNRLWRKKEKMPQQISGNNHWSQGNLTTWIITLELWWKRSIPRHENNSHGRFCTKNESTPFQEKWLVCEIHVYPKHFPMQFHKCEVHGMEVWQLGYIQQTNEKFISSERPHSCLVQLYVLDLALSPCKSPLVFLPSIDMSSSDVTSPTHVVSTLIFVMYSRHRGVKSIITFDQPLWWKAFTIKASEPIFAVA